MLASIFTPSAGRRSVARSAAGRPVSVATFGTTVVDVDELVEVDELVAALVLVLELDAGAEVAVVVSDATDASSSPEQAPATSASTVAPTRRTGRRRRMVIRRPP